MADESTHLVQTRDDSKSSRGRREFIDLFLHTANFIEKGTAFIDIFRKERGEASGEQIPVARDVERIAGHAHAIEALRVEAFEGDVGFEPQLAQEQAHRLLGAAVPDVVELRVESVLVLAVAVPKRLAIATGRAVSLEDLDALPAVGHERAKGQGGESTSNDEIVRFHISRLEVVLFRLCAAIRSMAFCGTISAGGSKATHRDG